MRYPSRGWFQSVGLPGFRLPAFASQVTLDRIDTPQAAHSPKKAKEFAPLLKAARGFWKPCLTTGCAVSLDGKAARGADSTKAEPDGRTLIQLTSSTLAAAARRPRTPKRAILERCCPDVDARQHHGPRPDA
mmetsp:Transcript_63306/g.100550  ORF Transcript_63306/g.100550 Transcript_63306/m.100550 type:complete len:132 (+) Transcript_63306:485-880(+)